MEQGSRARVPKQNWRSFGAAWPGNSIIAEFRASRQKGSFKALNPFGFLVFAAKARMVEFSLHNGCPLAGPLPALRRVWAPSAKRLERV
jgi:hypothetical protein